ncbi:hypothetical protein MA16_Dca013777 [Dendrobium catenatum]|uniref:Secreted protein n=1 Tax=Dendrobium catenatum TaxID=906689 RepID=A0A2I0VWG7_9ASPA|nr:hypothetical protein MA16_Dca013777 [Dendrobium catenatum]
MILFPLPWPFGFPCLAVGSSSCADLRFLPWLLVLWLLCPFDSSPGCLSRSCFSFSPVLPFRVLFWNNSSLLIPKF